MTRLVLFSFLAAVVAFCVVQDRVTAAGARRFVDGQREAIASGRQTVAVDAVMGPAIRESVEQGALWGGVLGGSVLAAGLAGALVVRRARS